MSNNRRNDDMEDDEPLIEDGESEVEDDDEEIRGEEAEEDMDAERDEVLGGEGVDYNAEDEEGEDLMANAENDYRAIPELDRYDEDQIDDTDYGGMDDRARMAAEREMRKRDRMERGDERRDMFDNDLDDDEEDDEADHARKRRQHRRFRDAGDLAREDDNEEDEDLVQVPPSVHMDDQVERRLERAWRRFFKTFKAKEEDEDAYFHELTCRMTEENQKSLTVDFNKVLNKHMPGLANWIIEKPDEVLPIMDRVVTDLTRAEFPTFLQDNEQITVRFFNLPVTDAMRDLRTFLIGQLVQVVGVITRRTAMYPKLSRVYMDCVKCGHTQDPFDVSDDKKPNLGSCASCQSKGPFVLNKEDTLYVNFQRLTIQEPPSMVPAGRVPRSKEVIVTGDQVDKVRPGDEVEVVGIYHSSPNRIMNARHGFPVFTTLIHCNHIRRKNDAKLQDLTDDDKQAIRQLSNDNNIRERLIKSVAPSIFGHDHIKTALCYAMFGGRRKEVKGKHKMRGDINVLVLGDPGVAKSQFLKYVEKTFHKTVYTTGKGASAVGLTASVRRDPITGEWTLEGGALVLADEGICLIDEFDKMTDQDRTSIHEAMEQQSISISKAGIITSLQAKCAVIAAANPIQGRYDSQLTFSENVDLSDPILSRFDVLAVVRDEADALTDERLADFVVSSHIRSHPDANPDEAKESMNAPLLRAAQQGDPNIKPVDQDLFKKYILYARHTIQPRLSAFDQEKLAKFYAEIRGQAAASGGMPLTVRHLESMIRMAEANAKMHLRHVVNERDIDCAIATMLRSFLQSQKHAIAQRLQHVFAPYIRKDKDSDSLLDFVLLKLFKKHEDYRKLISRMQEDDDDEGLHVEVPVSELEREADRCSMGRDDVAKFVGGIVFNRCWELNQAKRVITRKARNGRE